MIPKFFPAVSANWRCQAQTGTGLHIWWSCPVLHYFWTLIYPITSFASSLALDFTPMQYLLHHTSLSKHQYLKSLSMHMVNPGRLSILVHWRLPQPPTIGECLSRFDKLANMQKLIQTVYLRTESHSFTRCGLAGFIHDRTTTKYSTSVQSSKKRANIAGWYPVLGEVR